MSRIVDAETVDVRFPTSLTLDGSDAMNPAPDYSAAYLILRTDDPDGQAGHGFVFTIGRGTDVQADAVALVARRLVGRDVDGVLADLGGIWRELVHDSQLRWLGPEKGMVHMAIGAVVNALWDLKAKRAGRPLWQLLAGLTPEEIVDLVDFRYLGDALTRAEALEILRRAQPSRADRMALLMEHGYPAYTTTPGWLGYSDEKLVTLAREAVREGFTQIKLKVGADRADDLRRVRLARETVGPDIRIAVDANQRWEVAEALDWLAPLAEFDLAWVEEPTSPDDILGHAAIARGIAPIPVATGEHVQNRIVFKQLLQAGGCQIMQIDATRVAGVNENIANLLLAAKFGVPVCPHAGGVGLCETVQHLSMFDFVAVSGGMDGRMIEYVDHLHEHFAAPADVHSGRYWPPTKPGAGTEMLAASLRRHTYPTGAAWQGSVKWAGSVETQRIALHTRLKPGREGEYERVHAEIPVELDAALREAGVRDWRIWRSGQDLFHVVDVVDYQSMRRRLAEHPANIPWQARMAELLDVPDDYSGDDSGLSLVWRLP